MTLSDYVNQTTGKVIDYDGNPADAGQCVQLVEDYADKVNNQKLPVYPDAATYWEKDVPGYDKILISDGFPKRGDIVVYNRQLSGSEGHGHIDIALTDGNLGGYIGFDSNWGGNLTAHQVQHNNNNVLGSLRLKGGSMITDDITKYLYGAYLGRQPNQGELDSWRGRDTNTLVVTLVQSQEAHNYYAKVQAALKGTPTGTVLSPGNYTVK